MQFQGLLVTRNRVQASPLPMHKKLILAGLGLDCERGVLAAGPHGGLRRARFFLLFPSFLSSLVVGTACIVYVMGLAEWLTGCPAVRGCL